MDNSDIEAKLLVRRWALQQAGGKQAKVLELFGGKGVMRERAYPDVKQHLAFDLRGCEKGTWLQGDNRVLLQKHVNGWTLYDADAYVNPWIILSDVCKLRKPGAFVMVATCSVRRGLTSGKVPPFFRWVTGYGGLTAHAMVHRFYYDMLDAVVRRWQACGVQLIAWRGIASRAPGAAHIFYYAFTAKKA